MIWNSSHAMLPLILIAAMAAPLSQTPPADVAPSVEQTRVILSRDPHVAAMLEKAPYKTIDYTIVPADEAAPKSDRILVSDGSHDYHVPRSVNDVRVRSTSHDSVMSLRFDGFSFISFNRIPEKDEEGNPIDDGRNRIDDYWSSTDWKAIRATLAALGDGDPESTGSKEAYRRALLSLRNMKDRELLDLVLTADKSHWVKAANSDELISIVFAMYIREGFEAKDKELRGTIIRIKHPTGSEIVMFPTDVTPDGKGRCLVQLNFLELDPLGIAEREGGTRTRFEWDDPEDKVADESAAFLAGILFDRTVKRTDEPEIEAAPMP